MSKDANSSDWFGEPPYTSSPCYRLSRPAMPDFDVSPIRPTGKINGFLTLPSSPRASTPTRIFPRKISKTELDSRMATKSKIPRLVEGDVFLNSHLNTRPAQAMRQPVAATSEKLKPEIKGTSSKFFEKSSKASKRPVTTSSKVEKASLNASTNPRLVTADIFRRPLNNQTASKLPRPRALAELSLSKINIQQNALQSQRQKQQSSDTGIRAETSQSSKKLSPDPLTDAPALTAAPLYNTRVRYRRRSSPLRATEVDNLSDF